MIESLLRVGAFINLQTPSHGMTPLMIAVWNGSATALFFCNSILFNSNPFSMLSLAAAFKVEVKFGSSHKKLNLLSLLTRCKLFLDKSIASSDVLRFLSLEEYAL